MLEKRIEELESAQDITRAENQDNLQFVLEVNQLGAWEMELTTQTVFRTLQHDRIFGYEDLLPEWSLEKFSEHVHPEDLESVREIFQNALTKKREFSFECRIIRHDNQERWIWVTGRCIKGQGGQCNRMGGIVQDITHNKNTNLELQHREQLLAYIIKYDPSAIAVHDKDMRYLFVSDRYLKDYNVKEKDIIGKHHYEVFPDLPEKWKKVHQKALKGDVLNCDEDFYLKEDGSGVHTRWTCRPWHTETNEIGGIVLYTEVITERILNELHHRETANKLKLVLEHTVDGIFSVDKQNNALMVNASALRMLGYKQNELLGKAMHVVHHHTRQDGTPYPREKCPIFLTTQNGSITHEADEVFWKNDGSSFPVEYTSAPIIEKGEITGAVVSFRDITLRKNAEERIRKLNDQLLQIINTINRLSTAKEIIELQEIVATAARKLVNATGTTFVIKRDGFCHYVEEDTQMPLWKGNHFPLENCITGWVMLNKKPVIINDIYKDERIPIEVYKNTYVKSLAVFPANHQDPEFAIGCYWDTHYSPDSEEIQLIQTLAEAANIAYENISLVKNLEILVTERTKELELSNKELEAFSYSVSHDLRAPLRGISGFTNILLEDFGEQLDDEGLRLCHIVKDNARKMGSLIDDLLAFSRLTRKELKKSSIEVNTLVNSIFFELTNEAQRNVIKLAVKDLEPCYGDPSMIRQVLANLLSNAIKYTRKKENPQIEVFSVSDVEQTTYYFKDNGVGFNMKYKDKLFGVFQRLHSESEFEGTGVGLAIVQRIIHRHGGSVDAKGATGKGATFSFTLPRESQKKEIISENLKSQKSIL